MKTKVSPEEYQKLRKKFDRFLLSWAKQKAEYEGTLEKIRRSACETSNKPIDMLNTLAYIKGLLSAN